MRLLSGEAKKTAKFGRGRQIGEGVLGAVGIYSEGDKARYLAELIAETPERDEFRRDFARVIHCPSFRRLQGKTQLFPGYESDFFRNRLTHSLEVGQIAESIAHRINSRHPFFQENEINPRICLTAALLHDIGHPPFGHNGEEALDKCMKRYGGFEGNAQTLRIVTQIEKKRSNPTQSCPIARRAGLNLSYRTLGGILKYDNPIRRYRLQSSKVSKGYYREDANIVSDIKSHVAPGWTKADGKFKTIECSIMDLADDIAYSTYDLEDSFKAGFLTPSKLLRSDPILLSRVSQKVGERIGDPSFSGADVLDVFFGMFRNAVGEETYARLGISEADDFSKIVDSMSLLEQLENIAFQGEIRTDFTSSLVNELIEGVKISLNDKFPQLSTVSVDIVLQRKIETLKVYTYEAIIASNRVKLAEYRGYEVVAGIFAALTEQKGKLLLPDDIARLHHAAGGNKQKEFRIIADFIAGMTDRYALEFYGRLHSDSPATIFKQA